MLWAAANANGYSRHAWVSYKQAQELGGNVRRGEKCTLVFLFKFLERVERAADGPCPGRWQPFAILREVFIEDGGEGRWDPA